MFFTSRTVLSVSLAFVVLLAGCVSVGAPGTGPTDPATTTTNDPSPTTTTGPDGQRFPPGISEQGIVDLPALVDAHEGVLLADGAIVSFSSVLVRPDDSIDRESTITYQFGPGGVPATATGREMDAPGTDTTIDVFYNETTQTVRQHRGGEVEYSVVPRTSGPDVLAWASLPWHVQQFADVLEVGEPGGDGQETILQAELDSSPDNPGTETVVRMVVSPDGVVQDYEVRRGLPEEAATYVTTFQVLQIGGVTVTPPEWLDTVPPSASLLVDVFASTTDSGALQLEHVGGGDAIPAGTLVILDTEDERHEITVPVAIGPGESLYVFLDDEGRLRATEIPPKGGDVSLPGSFTASLVTTDGVTLFEESLGSPPRAG